MKFRSLLSMAAALGCLVAWKPVHGAEGKLGGTLFGDYYYVASGVARKQNGFEIRRVYLTYNLKWNDVFSGRVRLEAKDAGFGKGAKMAPFVKHAYLRYRKNDRAVYMGLSGTPTWSASENAWGYRSVEKTIMDLHKIGSSADLGVAFNGRLDGAGKIRAQLMLGNGSGQDSEVDNDKKVYALLHVKPGKSVETTAYFDWESKPGDMERMTLAGYVGLPGKAFHGGIEGFVRINRNQTAGTDVQVRGISAFGAREVSPKAKVFVRLDFFDPSNQAGGDREYLFIGGIDLMPTGDVHIMPNVLATVYQASGMDAVVIPRVTVWCNF